MHGPRHDGLGDNGCRRRDLPAEKRLSESLHHSTITTSAETSAGVSMRYVPVGRS